MKDAAIDKALERVAARMGWGKPFERGTGTVRRGRGIAIGFKAVIAPTTSVAIVNLYADGSCALYCSTVDMGQGSDTAMAQIVAEVLGIRIESITVVHPDTDVTPYDMATLGSRSTYHMGNAVRRAAEDARDKLLALAREVGVSVETTPIAEVFRKRYGMQAGNIVGTGSFIPTYTPTDHDTGQSANVTPFWMVGATGAEVEVDTDTGQVRVTRLVNVADVGNARSTRESSRPSCPARRSCSSASRCPRRWSSAPGNARTPRSPATRFPECWTFPRASRTRRSIRPSAAARSARKASARAAHSACRRRSRTRSTMRWACA